MKLAPMLTLLLLAPIPVLACTYTTPDPADAARGTVLIGFVTGDEYPDFEAALLTHGKAYPRTGRHVVRVTFIEALTGELIGPLEVETSCYSPEPSAGDRAVVVRYNGNDVVVPATDEYESALRAAIAKLPPRRARRPASGQ